MYSTSGYIILKHMADVARLTRSYQTHTKLTYERIGLGTNSSSYADHGMITNLADFQFLYILRKSYSVADLFDDTKKWMVYETSRI